MTTITDTSMKLKHLMTSAEMLARALLQIEKSNTQLKKDMDYLKISSSKVLEDIEILRRSLDDTETDIQG